MKGRRYIITQFEGQDEVDDLGTKLETFLKEMGALRIRTHKRLGCISFSIEGEEELFLEGMNEFLNRTIHPNCCIVSSDGHMKVVVKKKKH